MKFFEVVSKICPLLEWPIVNTVLFFLLVAVAVLFSLFGVKKAKPETKTSTLWLIRIIAFVVLLGFFIGFVQLLHLIYQFGIWWAVLFGVGIAAIFFALLLILLAHQKKKKELEEAKTEQEKQ